MIDVEENDVNQHLSEEEILRQVYETLKVKGYDPICQVVGYIISGDPTYITAYQDARIMITKAEREDLLEEIIENYINEYMKQS